MATGGWNGVSYQQMTEYVRSELKPLEDHMTAHDTWHLARVTAEEQANRANFRANISIMIAAAAVIVTTIFGIIHR